MNIPTLQKNLLNWYGREARDLPWRRTKDPYRIWVSEIMLQQTQVQTVIPYYKRWLGQFPNVASLAKAPESKVLKAWAGLGYYRRPRMIKEAAKQIAEKFNGRIPQSVEELIELPGIGRYTAGAIASIAFEKKVPILDGNVIRVLTRLFAISKSIHEGATQKKLWQLAEEILPEKKLGDFNQALMELGATVCFPQNPDCFRCPLNRICKAHQKKRETHFPVNGSIHVRKILKEYAFIVKRGKSVLLKQQRKGERWQGLWTFPYLDLNQSRFRIDPKKLHHYSVLSYGFTHHKIMLEVFETEAGAVKKYFPHACWVSKDQLSNYAFPSAHQKIAESLK